MDALLNLSRCRGSLPNLIVFNDILLGLLLWVGMDLELRDPVGARKFPQRSQRLAPYFSCFTIVAALKETKVLN